MQWQPRVRAAAHRRLRRRGPARRADAARPRMRRRATMPATARLTRKEAVDEDYMAPFHRRFEAHRAQHGHGDHRVRPGGHPVAVFLVQPHSLLERVRQHGQPHGCRGQFRRRLQKRPGADRGERRRAGGVRLAGQRPAEMDVHRRGGRDRRRALGALLRRRGHPRKVSAAI